MGDIGLQGAYGAQGGADALMQAWKAALQSAEASNHVALQNRQLDQTDALTRLKVQELADAKAGQLQDKKDARAQLMFSLTPIGGDVSPVDMAAQQAAGIPQGMFKPKPINAPAPPPALAAPGQTADAPVPGTIANSPSTNAPQFVRGATQEDLAKQAEQDRKNEATQAAIDAKQSAADTANWRAGISQQIADLKGDRQPTQHYQLQPEVDPTTGQQTGRFLGYNTQTNKWEPVAGEGPKGTKAPPGASQTATKSASKQTGLEAVSRVEKDIDAADQAGLIGPAAGRFYSALASAGTTGDPTKDELIGRLKADLLLTKMHVDAGIGGARAAASPLLLKNWEDLALKSSKQLLHGYTSGIRDDLNAGQTSPAASGGPKRIVYGIDGKPIS